jgi:MFS family permease
MIQSLAKREVSTARTLMLASAGSALEFYDFVIFAFFTPVIAKLFFPPAMPEWNRLVQTYALFAAGYIVRPLGGIVMAHFGDTRGRKQIFTLSLLLMALPTLTIGLLPTFAAAGTAAPLLLLLMRMLQGMAIGGEAPGAWVYVAEHARPGTSGFAIGLLTGGLTGGILLGSIATLVLDLAFTPGTILQWAWRLPFLFGGFFGLCSVMLRRWLSETAVFQEIQQRKATSRTLPLRVLFDQYKKAILLSAGSTWLLTAAIVVVILLTPGFLQKGFGVAPRQAQLANLAGIAALTISTIAVGHATDRWGVRKLILPVVLVLVAGTYTLYYVAGHDKSLLIPAYFLAGLGAGCVAFTPIAMIRAFPPEVRFTGLSFSYNVAYAIFGGLTPVAISWLAGITSLGPAHYMAAVAAIGVVSLLASPVADSTRPNL